MLTYENFEVDTIIRYNQKYKLTDLDLKARNPNFIFALQDVIKYIYSISMCVFFGVSARGPLLCSLARVGAYGFCLWSLVLAGC